MKIHDAWRKGRNKRGEREEGGVPIPFDFLTFASVFQTGLYTFIHHETATCTAFRLALLLDYRRFYPPPQGLDDPADDATALAAAQAALTDATANLEAALGAYDQAQADSINAALADKDFQDRYAGAAASYATALADSSAAAAVYNAAAADSASAAQAYFSALADSTQANADGSLSAAGSYVYGHFLYDYPRFQADSAQAAQAVLTAIDDSARAAKGYFLALAQANDDPAFFANQDVAIAAYEQALLDSIDADHVRSLDADSLYPNLIFSFDSASFVIEHLGTILQALYTPLGNLYNYRYPDASYYLLPLNHSYYFSAVRVFLPHGQYFPRGQESAAFALGLLSEFSYTWYGSRTLPDLEKRDAYFAHADAYLSHAQTFPSTSDSALIYKVLGYSYKVNALTHLAVSYLNLHTTFTTYTTTSGLTYSYTHFYLYPGDTYVDETHKFSDALYQAACLVDSVGALASTLAGNFAYNNPDNPAAYSADSTILASIDAYSSALQHTKYTNHIVDSLAGVIPDHLLHYAYVQNNLLDAYNTYNDFHPLPLAEAEAAYNLYLSDPNPVDLARAQYAEADAATINAINTYHTYRAFLAAIGPILVALNSARAAYHTASAAAEAAYSTYNPAATESLLALSAYSAATVSSDSAHAAYAIASAAIVDAQAQLIEAQAAYDLALAAYNALPTPPVPPDATLPVTGAGGAPVYYTLSGRAVSEPLKAGLYIVRGEGKVRKVLVK